MLWLTYNMGWHQPAYKQPIPDYSSLASNELRKNTTMMHFKLEPTIWSRYWSADT